MATSPFAPNSSLEILVFEVQGERHGVAASVVREVLAAVPLARVEGSTAAVEGLINVRGRVVPVLNMRRCLGLPTRPLQYTDHLIVIDLGGDDRVAALRVDRTIELMTVHNLAEARDLMPGLDATGRVAALPDGLIVVHDMALLLSQNQVSPWEPTFADPRLEVAP